MIDLSLILTNLLGILADFAGSLERLSRSRMIGGPLRSLLRRGALPLLRHLLLHLPPCFRMSLQELFSLLRRGLLPFLACQVGLGRWRLIDELRVSLSFLPKTRMLLQPLGVLFCHLPSILDPRDFPLDTWMFLQPLPILFGILDVLLHLRMILQSHGVLLNSRLSSLRSLPLVNGPSSPANHRYNPTPDHHAHHYSNAPYHLVTPCVCLRPPVDQSKTHNEGSALLGHLPPHPVHTGQAVDRAS
ncbi:MAG: hypothetical protein HYZ89_07715 [Candidatus Omnitrophica bacterium]|nr:hypothetical protein [Candidatus Omnitrophota bacterium]